ncbi:MAG: hypothetical protein JRN54_02820 [Nitrososphaerota archaeon]|nr:hypothetical protein [Nitrososphaerota archaeon]
MHSKGSRRSVAEEKPLSTTVRCGEKGCTATTTVRFKGTAPHLSYRLVARGWTAIGDVHGNVRFLCKRCSEPLNKEIEEDIKRREQEGEGTVMPSWLAQEGCADLKEDEEP